MKSFLKRALGFAIVLAMLGAGFYYFGGNAAQKQSGGFGGGRRAKAGADDVVPVIAAQARIGNVPIYLDGVGSARALNTVTVRPQVDGKILTINFDEGQEVKKGDLLAKIDPTTYQAQLDQALAKKSLDEVQLANAKLDMERYSKVGPNVVTQKQIDTQRALVAQYTAQLKSDDAAIANAKAILDYTDITAPIDGRTGIRLVDVGNLVRSGDAGIVVITQVRPISTLFTLPQQELPRINEALAKGTLKAIALDADGKKSLDEGQLRVVDNQVDQTTGTVRLKAEFPNTKLQLWPGQFVNVRLLIDTLQQVVIVPTPAIQRGPKGTFVYVVGADDKVTVRPVAIAQQTDTEAVVDKGVANSEIVITTGFARLQEGTRVAVTRSDDPNAVKPLSEADPSQTPAGRETRTPQTQAPATQPPAAAAPAAQGEPAQLRRGEGKRGEGKRKRDTSAAQ